jgi:hypothetical protein
VRDCRCIAFGAKREDNQIEDRRRNVFGQRWIAP